MPDEAERWGFYNRIVERRCAARRGDAGAAAELAKGPNFAHAMTKRMLEQEWSVSVEQAIEAEAQAQAICMQTQDFGAPSRPSPPSRSRSFGGN
jgi:enoyl-CoA hydratase/carnithine racemase